MDDTKDKVLPKEEVVASLEHTIINATQELEDVFIPQLNHGEAKRLLIAVLKYPREVVSFQGDREVLIRAFSAAKALKDALVGLSTEVVIERLIAEQMQAEAAQKAQEGSENV